jgi:hypothetical protein
MSRMKRVSSRIEISLLVPITEATVHLFRRIEALVESQTLEEKK